MKEDIFSLSYFLRYNSDVKNACNEKTYSFLRDIKYAENNWIFA